MEITKASMQIFSMLSTYTDDVSLSMVDNLENHGELAGLEAWRRLYTDQKGTLDQRFEDLRTQVLYPEKVSVAKVSEAITQWESAYSALTEACDGTFKLDDKG